MTFHNFVDQEAYAKKTIVSARVTFIDEDGCEVFTGNVNMKMERMGDPADLISSTTRSQEFMFSRRVCERYRDALVQMGVFKKTAFKSRAA